MTLPRPRASSAWLITFVATAASTYALDAVATAAGVLLVASGLLSGLAHPLVLAFLAATYVLWGAGLRANLSANLLLLRQTGTSTNALSKAAFELDPAARQSATQRLAAAAGYVAHRARQGGALLRGRVRRRGPHRHRHLRRRAALPRGRQPRRRGLRVRPRPPHAQAAAPRRACASFDTDWVPQDYLADYYSVVEPDERRDDRASSPTRSSRRRTVRPVLVFGIGPDAAPRLPRRAEGVGDPPRRLPAGEPRRDRALVERATRRPRLAAVRPLHAAMRGRRRADRRGDRATRGADPRQDHARCCRSTRATRSASTGSTRR